MAGEMPIHSHALNGGGAQNLDSSRGNDISIRSMMLGQKNFFISFVVKFTLLLL